MTANALAARSGGHKLRIGVGDGERRLLPRARPGGARAREVRRVRFVRRKRRRQNEKRAFKVTRRSSSMNA